MTIIILLRLVWTFALLMAVWRYYGWLLTIVLLLISISIELQALAFAALTRKVYRMERNQQHEAIKDMGEQFRVPSTKSES